MKKLFLVLIKYIPIIQLVGILFNNTLYYFGVNSLFSYFIDFVLGNSIITIILLFVISYVFGYCNWYRTILISNFLNSLLAFIDFTIGLSISDIQLLLTYYIISSVFIIIAVYSHVRKTKNNKRVVTRVSRQN